MKTLSILFVGMLVTLILSAQNDSPIPKLNQQLDNYFSYHPREKVFVTTDKSLYRPGETIWFCAYVMKDNNRSVQDESESQELFVKLYNAQGKQVLQEIFRLKNVSVPGDLMIPEDLPKGDYFLLATISAHISPEEISCIPLKIDPAYSDQLAATVVAKDSISVSGQKNELYLILKDVSGEIQKNTSLRYQLRNGTEIIEKGKLKTDESGKATIQFTIPEKTNGEPFICALSDVRDEWKHDVFLPTNMDPLSIRFYPEGGNLIAGIPAKIGFTAFNKWGIPVDVEGSIFDQEGKPITIVRTFTKGLGLFPLVNDKNQKYKLVLSGKTGQNQAFELPLPDSTGLALAIVKTDADFISAYLNFADKQKHSVAFIVTQGSNMVWTADLDINGAGRLKIPAVGIPQGINLLSVFSKEGNLLAERIVFMDKNQHLNIEVVPEKNKLQSNESSKIRIRLTDEKNQPVAGNISVAVAGKLQGKLAKERIDEYLQISSELETPFSLISGALKGKLSNSALMDVFLITNHTKSFNWGNVRNFKPENAAKPNSGNTGISGIVTDKNGTGINKAKVSLLNGKNIQIQTTITNSEGLFSFPNLNTGTQEDFSFKATDQEGKRELKVVLNKNQEAQITDFIAEYAQKYSLLSKDYIANDTYFSNNPDLFPKAPKSVKTYSKSLDFQHKLLSSSTNLLAVIKILKPFYLKNNMIVFIGSENSLSNQGGALLVIDGQPVGYDISVVESISPFEVDHINVSTNPMDILRYSGFNSVGVIEIFMKKAPAFDETVKKETASKYDGVYRIPNVFPTEPANPKHNNRTTLLWIPEQKVNESGLIEFPITAGSVISDFVIEVQGISENGRVGSGKAEFSVLK